MVSLESGVPLKSDHLLRSSSTGRTDSHRFLQGSRWKFSSFLLLKKLDYLQWICTLAVFLFFVFLFQIILHGSVIGKSGDSMKHVELSSGDLKYLKELGLLDYYEEDIRFEPSKLLEKIQKEAREASLSTFAFNRTRHHFGYRKAQLALVNDRVNAITATNYSFLYSIWEEQRFMLIASSKRTREEDMLRDRSDKSEVYQNARRAEHRSKKHLHKITFQPLCIYEPYFEEGVWPFLHLTSLYRGIRLSTKGRRPKADDVDAPSRLPLLNDPYYRDLLGEYGAFFAIANRIDYIHKNDWIGFQSWRITARKASLSGIAENALLEAIQTRRHGDTLYFWVRMDNDSQHPLREDFWSFCDATNAGNCKSAFSEAFTKMYGLKHNLESLESLPPMPVDGDTWSVKHSWALPTRSFLQFVMFSRIFVDALDAQMYDEHHSSGRCYLSLTKDKHCYSRLLELLINVWAYHSGRRMVYVHPDTGVMQEQHRFESRGGHMWIKWFSLPILKSMDEDLAKEYELEHPTRRWLWPSTGEVYWKDTYRLMKIPKRNIRHSLDIYVKPPPEDTRIIQT